MMELAVGCLRTVRLCPRHAIRLMSFYTPHDQATERSALATACFALGSSRRLISGQLGRHGGTTLVVPLSTMPMTGNGRPIALLLSREIRLLRDVKMLRREATGWLAKRLRVFLALLPAAF